MTPRLRDATGPVTLASALEGKIIPATAVAKGMVGVGYPFPQLDLLGKVCCANLALNQRALSSDASARTIRLAIHFFR
ncbi:hypothetical protein C0Q70_01553 [Pomacea canaliculata]|uniref:Uncharacterized protein n=1 Tax=Pomacea canaliculata TaxID=400727 RepID=A0A2T7PZT4_POMCA|nr:hypothetical protein C0Q70_01553 [Pomacea canaliculata]